MFLASSVESAAEPSSGLFSAPRQPHGGGFAFCGRRIFDLEVLRPFRILAGAGVGGFANLSPACPAAEWRLIPNLSSAPSRACAVLRMLQPAVSSATAEASSGTDADSTGSYRKRPPPQELHARRILRRRRFHDPRRSLGLYCLRHFSRRLRRRFVGIFIDGQSCLSRTYRRHLRVGVVCSRC